MDETTSGRMIEWAADRDVAENSFSVSRFFFPLSRSRDCRLGRG